jgi:hypothetical protein
MGEAEKENTDKETGKDADVTCVPFTRAMIFSLIHS